MRWGGCVNGLSGFIKFSVFSQHVEQVLHIFGQRGLEFDYFFSCWVSEFECMSVKRRSGYNRFLGSRFNILQLPGVDEFASVHIICDDGVLYI